MWRERTGNSIVNLNHLCFRRREGYKWKRKDKEGGRGSIFIQYAISWLPFDKSLCSQCMVTSSWNNRDWWHHHETDAGWVPGLHFRTLSLPCRLPSHTAPHSLPKANKSIWKSVTLVHARTQKWSFCHYIFLDRHHHCYIWNLLPLIYLFLAYMYLSLMCVAKNKNKKPTAFKISEYCININSLVSSFSSSQTQKPLPGE